MAEFRGRHFGFLGLLCATWVAARMGFLTFAPNLVADISNVQAASPRPAFAQSAPKVPSADTMLSLPYCCAALPQHGLSIQRGQTPLSRTTRPLAETVHQPQMAERAAIAPPAIAHNGAVAPASVLLLPSRPAESKGRFQFYAYSFLRPDSQGAALASGSQYGGSQSGFVATYALSRFSAADERHKLSLVMRGAIAHDNLREREVAAGLRWRPLQHYPVTLNAERRFRADRADAVAAYVAGGVSEVRLPRQFRFEAFGQAGVVSGKNAGPFFDFLARADRKVAQVGDTRLSAGAGIWGGGQDNVRRIDLGPSLRADTSLGAASFRLSADWRFRIAGQANPANGPAITLSTSF